jgi:hypothetical protein
MEHYLNRLLSHYGLSVNAFEQEVGVGNGTIAKVIREGGGRELSPKTVRKILDRYTDINPNWLLSGEGDMFLSTSDKAHRIAQETGKPHAKKPIRQAIKEFLLGDWLTHDKNAKEIEEMAEIIRRLEEEAEKGKKS